RRSDKSAHEKVAPMNFEKERCLRPNRLRVIVERRLVSRADFAQFGAGAVEDLGDAKSASDLNHFTARNNDLRFLFGQMMRDQNQSRGTVVNHGGGFTSAEQREHAFRVPATGATRAGV